MQIDHFVVRIREKVGELHAEFEKGADERRRKFRYRLEQGKVVFEQAAVLRHRVSRMKLHKFLIDSKLGAVITAPVIYSLIVPIALLDLFMTVYQHINFRVYRIPRVKRSEFIVMDRQYLAYLNIIQKVNCIYCEYANGVIAYAREIACRTEQFWCPIKHARKVMNVHNRYNEFIEYGDSDDFGRKYRSQREKCRIPDPPLHDAANDEANSAA
ncbi:MAG: hypothetical protein KGL10_06145 [Alphaproteobacteria bacterium]|nr:hypothetical protein [Alphaproteobacteria bacterium]